MNWGRILSTDFIDKYQKIHCSHSPNFNSTQVRWKSAKVFKNINANPEQTSYKERILKYMNLLLTSNADLIKKKHNAAVWVSFHSLHAILKLNVSSEALQAPFPSIFTLYSWCRWRWSSWPGERTPYCLLLSPVASSPPESRALASESSKLREPPAPGSERDEGNGLREIFTKKMIYDEKWDLLSGIQRKNEITDFTLSLYCFLPFALL